MELEIEIISIILYLNYSNISCTFCALICTSVVLYGNLLNNIYSPLYFDLTERNEES